MTKRSGARALAFALAGVALAVGLPFLTTANPLSGQQGPAVSIEDGQIPGGGSEVTTLWALDVTDPHLCGFTVDVGYDRLVKVATDCSADPESNFDLAVCNVDDALGTIRVAGAIGSSLEGVTGDIPLADITWCALGSPGEATALDVQIVNFVDCGDLPAEITPVADQDGVNVIAAGSPPADSDGDGFHDCPEAYMGTDPADDCADDSSDAAWPLDINNDRAITVTGDVLAYSGRIGAALGDPNYWNRLDLNQDGAITVTGDVLMYSGKIGASCT